MEQSPEQQFINSELRQIFPKLTPTNKAPVMFTLNGCGTTLYGKRNHHAPTDSYVKTYVICLLFLPIVALTSYRVQDAEGGGWYFLGKEPISSLARSWNIFVLSSLLCAVGFGVWSSQQIKPTKYKSYPTKTQAQDDRDDLSPARMDPQRKGSKLRKNSRRGQAKGSHAPSKSDRFGTFLDDEVDTKDRPKSKQRKRKKAKPMENEVEEE